MVILVLKLQMIVLLETWNCKYDFKGFLPQCATIMSKLSLEVSLLQMQYVALSMFEFKKGRKTKNYVRYFAPYLI
jgi:hypothetical protein